MGGPEQISTSSSVEAWVDRLTDRSADAGRRQLLALRAVHPHAPEFISEVLVPCQHEVGKRWMSGAISATMEHRVTAMFERIVAESLPPVSPWSRPSTTAVVAVQGDPHSLSALLLSWLVAEAGGTVDYLGAGVPAEDLESQLERHAYSSVAVSCATSAHLVGACRTITALHEHGIGVLAGGAGFGADVEYATLLGADATAATLTEGVARLARPISRTSDVTPDADRIAQALLIDRLAMSIAADVVDQLADRMDLSLAPPGLVELATISVRATAGAVLLDRPKIVADHTDWLRSLLLLRVGAGWSAPLAMRIVVGTSALHAPDAAPLLHAVL